MARSSGVQLGAVGASCALAIILALACGLAVAQDASSEQYYTVTLDVPDRSERARRQAMRKALGIVLRRMTGRAELPTGTAVRGALDAAEGYALSFGYARRGDGGSAMIVRFDPRGIRQVIEEAGLSVWSLARPRVVAWVLVEGADKEMILDASSQHGIALAMKRSAEEFGVPLVFPLMDIDERLEMRPMLLRGLFFDQVRQASRRYDADYILLGRVAQSKDNDDWSGSWVLSQPGTAISETASNGAAEAVARAGLGFVLEALSSRFALHVQSDVRVRISVEGVRGLSDYAALLRYLRELDGVERAETRELTRDLLTLDIWLATSWEGFLDLLGQDRRLLPGFVVNLPEGEKRMIWRAEAGGR